MSGAFLAIGWASYAWARETLSKTLLNRRLAYTLGLHLCAQMLLGAGAWLGGISPETSQLLHIFTWTMTLTLLSVWVEPWFALLAVFLAANVALREYYQREAHLGLVGCQVADHAPHQLAVVGFTYCFFFHYVSLAERAGPFVVIRTQQTRFGGAWEAGFPFRCLDAPTRLVRLEFWSWMDGMLERTCIFSITCIWKPENKKIYKNTSKNKLFNSVCLRLLMSW